MSGRRRALLVVSGAIAVLGIPWAIEAYRILLGAAPWRQPAIPVIRLDTPRNTTRRHP